MSSKGKIDSIADIPKIEAEVKKIGGSIDFLLTKLEGMAEYSQKVNFDFKGVKNLRETERMFVALGKAQDEAGTVTVELTNKQKELLKAQESLDRQRNAALAVLAKQEQKERELQQALTLEVKSLKDAEMQNKALTEAKKRLDLTTDQGKTKLKEYNDTLNKNTSFIKENGSEADKQRMNIGNYGSALEGVKGVALNLMGALGITAGLSGAMKLAEGIMASTDATADALGETTAGLKEQMGFLARSIATMDFSNFIQGMREANKAGREYYKTLDLIENLKTASDLQVQEIETKILRQRLIAKTKFDENGKEVELSIRKAAIDEIVRLEGMKLETQLKVSQLSVENETKDAAQKAKVNKDLVADFIKNYDSYRDRISEGQKLIAGATTTSVFTNPLTGLPTVKTSVDEEKRLEIYQSLTKEQQKSVDLSALDAIITDEKRQMIKAAMLESEKAIQDEIQGRESLVKMNNTLYSQLIGNEKEASKELEKQRSNYQMLEDDVKSLTEQIQDLVLAGKTPPQSMISELVAKKDLLEDVKKQVEGIAEGLVKIKDNDKGGLIVPSGLRSKMPTLIQPDQQQTELGSFLESSDQQIEAAQATANSIFTIMRDNDQAILEGKLSDLEKEKDEKLKNSKLTASQKEDIEKEYDTRARKLRTEAAKKERAANIIEAIVQGALSVLKAPPGTKIITAIESAALLAAIIAQPLPKYRLGRKNGPEEWAIVGEAGREIIEHNGMKMLTPDMATLTKLPAGAKVIPNEETMKELSRMGLSKSGDLTSSHFQRLEESININFEKLSSTVKNKREYHYNITEAGMRLLVKNGDNWAEYVNKNINM